MHYYLIYFLHLYNIDIASISAPTKTAGLQKRKKGCIQYGATLFL